MRKIPLPALAIAFLALLGCSSDDTGPSAAEAGTYDLIEVNGAALPVVVHSEERTDGLIEFSVTSGSVRLDGDRFQAVLRYHLVADGEILISDDKTDTGTYTITGTSIAFDPETGSSGTLTGTLVDGTLTIETVDESLGRFVAVYRR